MPQLQDTNFFHTTSLLSEFTKEGAMGIILNRPLDITLDLLLGEKEQKHTLQSMRAFWGGPVQNDRGIVLHEDEEFISESVNLDTHLYMSGSSDVLKQLIKKKDEFPNNRFRLFLGYAGWGPGQLEKEMAESSWITSPINKDLIFSSATDKLWEQSIEGMGIDLSSLASAPHTQIN